MGEMLTTKTEYVETKKKSDVTQLVEGEIKRD